MRHYQKLNRVTHDTENDTLLFTCDDCTTNLWFGREGMYVSVSAQYGPLELALRPRLADFVSCLNQLPATETLAAMRMVGTGQAHLELGLSNKGELLIRSAIVADATGHFAVNAIMDAEPAAELMKWLGVERS